MGRRSIISVTEINRMMSSYRRRQREKERDELISLSGGKKELPPEYDLSSVEYNASIRMAKISFRETKKYRTVERYVTKNYQKYAILSEWKRKTKTIDKSVKLTNEVLESLNRHSDYLIADFAFEIIARLNDIDLTPSWYLIEYYNEEYRSNIEILDSKERSLTSRHRSFVNGKENVIKQLKIDARPLKTKRNKFSKKIEKIELKIEKKKAKNKPYARLHKKLQKNESKREPYIKEISDIAQKINALRQEIEDNKQALDCAIGEITEQKNQHKKTLLENKNSVSALVTEIPDQGCKFTPIKKLGGMAYKKIIGCYVILNTKNHKYYVGQSKDVLRRLKQHFKDTVPQNPIFAEDYYTTDVSERESLFEVSIIPLETKDELDETERELIEQFGANVTGYNSTRGNT